MVGAHLLRQTRDLLARSTYVCIFGNWGTLGELSERSTRENFIALAHPDKTQRALA
jgi:hypothetical protein